MEWVFHIVLVLVMVGSGWITFCWTYRYLMNRKKGGKNGLD